MNNTEYPSKLLENAVNEFSKLPGIGSKTAMRLVLHLLRQDNNDVTNFGESVIKLKKEVTFCKVCNNISDNEICNICADNSRTKDIVCVVENLKDVISIENTGQYKGVYHVLGGIISPIDGLGPNDINITTLENRAKQNNIKEIIFALPTTMEGDTTNYYIHKKIKEYVPSFSVLARGVAIGDKLEYTDEITLGRSIINRTNFL
jgi:recombination protein RecR